MSDKPKCPVCDRPPVARNNDKTGCYMWWILSGGGCSPSSHYLKECYAHASPWRLKFDASQLELADTKAKLAAAQRALSRLHDKQVQSTNLGRNPIVEVLDQMFPDDARIE